MLAAILLATGIIRFAMAGVPAVGRSMRRLGYRTSNRVGRLVSPQSRNTRKGAPGRGGLFYRLTRPFRRLPRATKAQRPGHPRGFAAWWSQLMVRMRMSRSGLTRTRAGVDSHKRYWQLRFRRWIPWRR
jgi:hypothetical protein